MKKQLTPDDWKKVYDACLYADRIFLLSAINAALEQMSQQALANIAFELAKQNATIEPDSSRIRIDPQGKYSLSIN